MKINKNYFSYLFKSKELAWIFIAGIYTALSLSPFLYNRGTAQTERFVYSLQYASMFSLCLAFVLPIFLFSFVHRKRSVDQIFSLPLRRSELLVTTIVFMLLVCISPYILVTILSCIFSSFTSVSYIAVLLSLFHLILGVTVLLCVNTAIYLFSNNIIDGIIILAAYTCLPLCYITTLYAFTEKMLISNTLPFMSISSYLSPFLLAYSNQMQLTYTLSPSDFQYVSNSIQIIDMIVLVVYFIVSLYFLKKHFINRKVERAEGISNNVESYPFIINFYLFFSLIYIAFSSIKNSLDIYVILYILLFAIYLVAICIYKRKIKFYIKNIVLYFIVAIVSFTGSRFIFKNEAFGLPYKYKETSNVIYRYNAYNMKSDLSGPDVTYTDDAYYIGSDITVFFTFEPTKANMKTEKYQEVYQIIDNYRNACIKEWFSSTEADDAYTVTTLEVDGKNDFYYRSKNTIPLEDLETISKVTHVHVETYDEGSGNTSVYDLADYLSGGNPIG